MTRLLLAAAFTALALFSAGLALAQSPATVDTPGLYYRLQVFTGFLGADRPAPDGTRLVVSRLPRPAAIETRPPYQGPCAEAAVRGGYAEITVVFRPDCAPGDAVGIRLYFEGQLPITASAEPELEWRSARPGEPSSRTSVVRPIPPRTGGNGSTVIPPTTGSAGLLRPLHSP